MGITDGICDSCEEKVGYLFPVVVLDELPSGGTKMVTKYYCIDCYEEYMDIAKEDLENEEKEKEKDEEDFDEIDSLIREYNIKITYCGLEKSLYCENCKFRGICELTELTN